MKITLKDIARESGYSITTVSRALGGFDDVNEQTRAFIVQVAAQLGYQPNLVARQLQSQRTFTIGLIIPTKQACEEDDFFNTLLSGVVYTAARQHYDVLVSAQLPEDDEMDAYRKVVGGNRVDGMIIARTRQGDPRIAYLTQHKHPFVVAGRLSPEEESDFPFIDADSQHGIKQLVLHFVDYGHQHIGCILPPPELAYTAYRLQGYQEGLAASGLHYNPNYVAHGDMTRESGYTTALQLLHDRPRLSAIIASNDLMAMGAMRAIQELGLSVGNDVAVGGFDDIPAAKITLPSLTTVRQPICEIGGRLTDMLIKLINGETLDESRVVLQPNLIIRESSGSPQGAQ